MVEWVFREATDLMLPYKDLYLPCFQRRFAGERDRHKDVCRRGPGHHDNGGQHI